MRKDERGDIVLGWLTKLVAGLAVVGITMFDGLSIGAAHVAASEHADEAAQAAADAWHQTHNAQGAYQAAADSAALHDDRVVGNVTFAADGTVHLRLRHNAVTLLIHRIGPLAHLAHVTAGSSAQPAP